MENEKIKFYIGGLIAIVSGILTLLALSNILSFGDYIILSVKGLIGISILSKSMDILSGDKSEVEGDKPSFFRCKTISGNIKKR